jgi:hypothetical protein
VKKTFDDLANWTFEIEEVSANVYQVTATDRVGRRIQVTGLDIDALLADAREGALKIVAEIEAPTRGVDEK